MIRFQSDQNMKNRTMAVAKWVATRNVRKNVSFWWMSQPNTRGSTTAWPSELTGNGSAKPWSTPSTMAWK